MGESNQSDIAAILLGFSTLGKTQRKEFMSRLNEFVYVSSQKKRQLMDGWLGECRESANPVANRIAESMADYVVPEHKRSKR